MDELGARVTAAINQRAKREARKAKGQKWEKITSLATAAAVIVALVAIFLSYISLIQQQKSAVSQDQDSRYSSISQLNLDVDQTIADHPRLIPCFLYGGCKKAKPALTAQEWNQAWALSGYIVDFYQYLFDQLENLGYLPPSGEFIMQEDATPADEANYENWITWSETIVGGFESSPLECTWLTENHNGYEQLFVHDVAITGACGSTLPDPFA